MASGGNDIGAIDTVPETETYVLYGGVVGGPDKNNNYFDQRSDYTQTEIALDYNAPVLSLTAARIQYQAWTAPPSGGSNAAAGGPLGDPVYVALELGTRVQPPRDESLSGPGGLSVSGRLGIVISVAIMVLFAAAVLGWFFGNKMV
jgi:endoglucanase